MARLRPVATSQATGCCGDPVARPALGRDRKRLLGGLLGQIHVAEEADQGRQDAAPLAPEDLLDQCAVSTGISTSGRTSTAPPSRTAGIRCADLQRLVQVGRFEHEVAAEHLLGVGVGTVGDQVLAAAVANRGRRLDRLQVSAAQTARVLAERPVLGGHRLGLVLSERLVAARLGVDQQRVLHTRLLWGWLIILETNGRHQRGQRPSTFFQMSTVSPRVLSPVIC